jgi:hypothetical protein
MSRVLKSIVLSGAVAVAALFASGTEAHAQGFGVSFGTGYPNYGYPGYTNYGYQNFGISNYGYGGYGGGYGNYNNAYNPYAFGYQTFYTPGSNFRGAAPWGSAYRSHFHCR